MISHVVRILKAVVHRVRANPFVALKTRRRMTRPFTFAHGPRTILLTRGPYTRDVRQYESAARVLRRIYNEERCTRPKRA